MLKGYKGCNYVKPALFFNILGALHANKHYSESLANQLKENS